MTVREMSIAVLNVVNCHYNEIHSLMMPHVTQNCTIQVDSMSRPKGKHSDAD